MSLSHFTEQIFPVVPRCRPSQLGRCLRVSSLSSRTNTDELRSAFSSFGAIEDVKIMYDFMNGHSGCLGFITFKYTNDAAVAKNLCNHTLLDGRRIRVDFALMQSQPKAENIRKVEMINPTSSSGIHSGLNTVGLSCQKKTMVCVKCNLPILGELDAVKLSCGHLFGSDCLEAYQAERNAGNNTVVNNNKNSANNDNCPACIPFWAINALREELTCSICLELFEVPFVLNCGHTFCAKCTFDLNTHRFVQCPLCRTKITEMMSCPITAQIVLKVKEHLDWEKIYYP